MGLRIIYITAVIVLVGGFQLIAGLAGSAVALASGAVVFFLPYGLYSFLENESHPATNLYMPGIATTAGILLGGVARWASHTSETIGVDLVATLLGAISSGLIIAIRMRHRSQRCRRCGRHLGRAHRRCPRCECVMCGHPSCWNQERFRCADCDWLQRPLLPLLNEEWWVRRLGPRLERGQCQRCRKDARDADLRKKGPMPMADVHQLLGSHKRTLRQVSLDDAGPPFAIRKSCSRVNEDGRTIRHNSLISLALFKTFSGVSCSSTSALKFFQPVARRRSVA